MFKLIKKKKKRMFKLTLLTPVSTYFVVMGIWHPCILTTCWTIPMIGSCPIEMSTFVAIAGLRNQKVIHGAGGFLDILLMEKKREDRCVFQLGVSPSDIMPGFVLKELIS